MGYYLTEEYNYVTFKIILFDRRIQLKII